MSAPRSLALTLAAWIAVAATAQAAEPDEARLQRAAELRNGALAAIEEGNYGRAVEELSELATILPDNVLPPVNLAICHLRLGRVEQALAEVERARRLDPDNPQALYALARVLEQSAAGREAREEVLARFEAAHPYDPRPHYLRSLAATEAGDPSAAAAALAEALRRAPENLALMTELLVAAAEAGDGEAAEEALYAIEDRLNGFEGSQTEFADALLEALDQGDAAALRPPAWVLRNLLRPTELYQLGLQPLLGRTYAGADRAFLQLDFEPPLPKRIQGGQDIPVRLLDRSAASGADLPTARTVLPVVRGDQEAILAGDESGWWELAWAKSRFAARRIDGPGGGAGPALAVDIDQDGLEDLVTVEPAAGLVLRSGRAAGGYGEPLPVAPADRAGGASSLFALDIDHDADLDLLVSGAALGTRYLQNHGDGRWTDQTDALGIAGGSVVTGLASADFDDDGDLDLLLMRPAERPALYLNRRAGALEDASLGWGLTAAPSGLRGVRVADFDGDGRFDLLLWGEAGGGVYGNDGRSFQAVEIPDAPAPGAWQAAAVGDFDNDADADAVAVAAGRVWLLRNRRDGFELEDTGLAAGEPRRLTAGDFDGDGDLDIVASGGGGWRFWQNDGGNRNQWVRLRLRGRSENNSKNNTQGLFTRVESRVGDRFQMVAGNGRFNHLGLGAARQADVIRVVWTNGLAQTWLQVGANRTLVEEQVLKGSCPFLYTWNGERFEFVTDLLWKSPLGMILADGSPAPHQAARDWVLVRGEALRPVGGELWLQITEELWEAAYLDRVRLLAVDYPADAELVVDEKFHPPPHPERPPLHFLGESRAPAAARDHAGRDVTDRLRSRDGRHVDGLPLDRYQGLTHGHRLEMTFERVPVDRPLRLVLHGWTFPTDTSINFALAQDSGREPLPPTLDVRAGDGWRPLPGFIGFPSGKRKSVVVDLTGRVPAGTVTLRLATSMQIYWDSARLAIGRPPIEAVRTALDPIAADLHYRGYSALYREGAGPHLFDYTRVATGPRFRDLRGRYTRFGEVSELLAAADDRYVVMNAGDELTVRFDARRLPPVPPGWRRDYVLETGGWVKDGDLHTTRSQTVEPWPYHGMSAYPDRPRHRPPDSPEWRAWLDHYQTRTVDGRGFVEALSNPPASKEKTP